MGDKVLFASVDAAEYHCAVRSFDFFDHCRELISGQYRPQKRPMKYRSFSNCLPPRVYWMAYLPQTHCTCKRTPLTWQFIADTNAGKSKEQSQKTRENIQQLFQQEHPMRLRNTFVAGDWPIERMKTSVYRKPLSDHLSDEDWALHISSKGYSGERSRWTNNTSNCKQGAKG
jgi:hypothetical protein